MISRILAAAAPEGAEAPNPLLPADYDILWSSVVFVVLLRPSCVRVCVCLFVPACGGGLACVCVDLVRKVLEFVLPPPPSAGHSELAT